MKKRLSARIQQQKKIKAKLEKPVKKKTSKIQSFPSQLFQLLTLDDGCAEWDEGGTSFTVTDMDKLLRLHTKHNNATSFQRQLNLYGFRKVPKCPILLQRYQRNGFQKDRPDLLPCVQRGVDPGEPIASENMLMPASASVEPIWDVDFFEPEPSIPFFTELDDPLTPLHL